MGFSCFLKTACLWSIVHYVATTNLETCECYSTDGFVNKCHCEGDISSIHEKLLGGDLHSLSVSNANILKLQNNSLDHYKNSLAEVTIMNSNLLQMIEPEVFNEMINLKHLTITHTSLAELPELVGLGVESSMHIIDLESNKIQNIHSNNVKVRTEQLFLDYNKIKCIEGWAFNGSEIAKLSLKGNTELTDLSIDAFNGLKSLRDLDLSETSVTFLPVLGLEGLEILRLINTFTLKVIPSIYDLSNLQNAWLTYSFHCCAFHNPEKHDPFRHQEYLKLRSKLCEEEAKRLKRDTYNGFGQIMDNSTQAPSSRKAAFESTLKSISNGNLLRERRFMARVVNNIFVFRVLASTYIRNSVLLIFSFLGQYTADVIAPFAIDSILLNSINLHSDADLLNETNTDGTFHQIHAEISTDTVKAICGDLTGRFVSCWPKPDALNPCEDMMSWVWLRIAIWFVILTGILGNMSVLVVLCLSKTEKSVPRFLMCNLAFADMIMATYLLMLAIMDSISRETYFNYAYDWQRGYGCKIAGFLTVFANQLSLFTLSLLTIERWFAIRHALYLNMLDLRITSNIMVAGWIYSIIMGLLPLVGVSGYSNTSICLPMDSKHYISQVYIISMIIIAGCAFLLMCICYTQIYFSLSYETRHSTSEGAIARKMTILVGTNFVCWAPVAFFSFTALAGYPLITISQSKILLVFIYPINSCANPYLYAILTKQYRKDCIAILTRYCLHKRSANHIVGYSRPVSNDLPGPQTTAETLL